MKRFTLIIFFISFVILAFSCSSSAHTGTEGIIKFDAAEKDQDEEIDISSYLPQSGADLPVSSFGEIWVYVVEGRESALVPGLPITDIGYFAAEIDTYGKLTNVPARNKLNFKGRVHLVVKCDGRALTHFVLKPGSPERKAFIEDLVVAAKDYDGLQINLEYVPARSGPAFHSFLAELRQLLGNKIFSIAIAARTRKIENDVYDYDIIAPLMDRMLVMAYDEHWSGSKPGSIASIAWCRRVAEYSLKTIGSEKLIMGLPFYGRAWGNYSPSRALIYTSIENIIRDRNVTNIRRTDGIPNFNYTVPVDITLFYEDEYSLSARMDMYKTMGVKSVGFWRLGQETSEIWKYLKVDN